MLKLTLCLAVAMLTCTPAMTHAGEENSDDGRKKIIVSDQHGQAHSLFAPSDHSATVLFFLLPDCPVSNATVPEIRRIVADYRDKSVSCCFLYVDSELKPEAARKHAEEYKLSGSILVDPQLRVASEAGAKIAPSAVVLGADGQVQYRGRINDLYADYGRRRAVPSRHDVRDALDDILAGRAVATPETKPIGCFISFPATAGEN